MKNQTTVTTFILLGLTDDTPLKILLFIFLFLSYVLSISGNLTIITLTLIDSHLKTPMYLFLQNFSFLEISFTTACVPRFLYSTLSGDKSITYNACVSQVFFTDLFAVTEFFLLAAMSYDRYVAICKPLCTTTIMNSRVCKNIIFSCWVAALITILPPISLGLGLEFCDSNISDHFCWCILDVAVLVAWRLKGGAISLGENGCPDPGLRYDSAPDSLPLLLDPLLSPDSPQTPQVGTFSCTSAMGECPYLKSPMNLVQ
ncbi:PREDICTED: olfactory receptor 6C2-like [Myotis davidii]|uniref:olfactory receptor 6C2-like n=1 Tax=Myotis davidii TaxID=225400 RepID=UPI0003EBE481|nr:PREDICTED: olfactory receptor 6C2-like [Myotis davidii]